MTIRLVQESISHRRITNCKWIGSYEDNSVYLMCNRWDGMKQFYIIPSGIKIDLEGYKQLYVKTCMTKYPDGADELSNIIRDGWSTPPPKLPWNSGRLYT